MGTPYHAKKNSDGANPVVTAGFTPGGHIATGYSYLQRSHSYKTSTRRNVPQGLESPSTAKQFAFASPSPNPSPTQNHSTWLQRSSSCNSLTEELSSPRPARRNLDFQVVSDLVAQLPPNPKSWTPSQVALYLTQVLGLTPKPVVQDVTNYVRSSGMGGKVFLRLREKDLEAEGLNLKWRRLMIEAVKKLRRDCLRGRIWGYEGGLQLPRQEDDLMLQDACAAEDEFGAKQVTVTAMGTLKRLRDKKAVKAMISTYENGLEDDPPVATSGKGHRSHGCLSSLHSSASSEQLNRDPLPPIYGKGFVKFRADSYTSLSDASPRNKHTDFTKEELEHWFGSLSDQEAEALVNELQDDEELSQMEHEKHHISSSRSYSSHSSVSGESEACTPPPIEQAGFDLTPLDADIIEAIVGQPLDLATPSEASNTDLCVEPLHRDHLLDDETIMLERSQSITQLRNDLLKGTKMNLYRESTYDIEGIEALGLHVDDDDGLKYGTAKKIDRPSVDGEECLAMTMDPSQDDVRIKAASSSAPLARDIFGTVDVNAGSEAPDHMRRMSALEACGLSPYKSVSPGMSRTSSQHKRGGGEKSAAGERGATKGNEAKESNMATFGRKGGAGQMQLTSMLQASGLCDDPVMTSTSEDIKKAEDESEWGVTVSRKASRRGTLAKAVTRNRDNAAGRMADLFTQASNVPQDELNANNLKELEMASSSREHLHVPMTLIESSEDGKSISRKRSMVLVEREKFEALARRMGVLESQLAQLEAASLPSLSDLGSMSDRGRSRRLDEIFAVPVSRPSRDLTNEEKDEDETDGPARPWSFPMLLGAIPSYVVGLSAGLTVVLLKEVMGRSRH